jgi:hypothetical protein
LTGYAADNSDAGFAIQRIEQGIAMGRALHPPVDGFLGSGAVWSGGSAGEPMGVGVLVTRDRAGRNWAVSGVLNALLLVFSGDGVDVWDVSDVSAGVRPPPDRRGGEGLVSSYTAQDRIQCQWL